MARLPKSTKAKKASGTYRADRHGKEIEVAAISKIKPPASMKSGGKALLACFFEVASAAESVHGQVAESDVIHLEVCARLLHRIREIETLIDQLPLTAEHPKTGDAIAHPDRLSLLRLLPALVSRYCTETGSKLGLDIASRSMFERADAQAPGAVKKGSAIEEFIGGGQD